jgi:non-ribosomal peptide synthase protein (TIGR01720 family)
LLDEARTRALLTKVPSITGAHIDDVLVAALAIAVTEWTGHHAVSIDLEGHGREDIAADIDLSRTVGWFTSIAPVRVEADADEPFVDTVRSVGRTLARRRHRGIGFGALRYLSSDPRIRSELAAMPDRPISFNYLGQLGRTRPGGGVRGAPESAGPMRHPLGRRVHMIEVDSSVSNDQMSITWHYCRDLHRASTIERVAAAMGRVLQRAADDAINSTHAFPAAGVDPAEVDAVLSRLRVRAELEET